MQSIEIRGLKDLKRALRDLPVTFGREVLPVATRRAAEVIRREARKLVRVGRGVYQMARSSSGKVRRDRRGLIRFKTRHLRDTIRIVRTPWPVSGQVTWVVTAGGLGVRYAHIVEFGSAPHRIGASVRGVLKARSRAAREAYGDAVLRLPGGRYLPHVDHPGTAPRPFMRPAFDGNTGIAIAAAVKVINEKITALGGRWWTK